MIDDTISTVTPANPIQQKEQLKEENKTAINLVSRMMGAAVLSGGYVFRFLGAIPSLLLICVTVVIYVGLNNYYIDAFYYTNTKTFRELA